MKLQRRHCGFNPALAQTEAIIVFLAALLLLRGFAVSPRRSANVAVALVRLQPGAELRSKGSPGIAAERVTGLPLVMTSAETLDSGHGEADLLLRAGGAVAVGHRTEVRLDDRVLLLRRGWLGIYGKATRVLAKRFEIDAPGLAHYQVLVTHRHVLVGTQSGQVRLEAGGQSWRVPAGAGLQLSFSTADEPLPSATTGSTGAGLSTRWLSYAAVGLAAAGTAFTVHALRETSSVSPAQ